MKKNDMMPARSIRAYTRLRIIFSSLNKNFLMSANLSALTILKKGETPPLNGKLT